MTPDHWLAILSRLTPETAIDLDPAPEVPAGQGLPGWPEDGIPVSARLWERCETGASYLGVRLDEPIAEPEGAALRLAAAALERGVAPIILTALDQTGFERFGFRIERFLPGPGADRAAWEAEMTAFWQLAIIIDAADVAALG
ncbi:MAG: hypothetical protein KDE00_13175 [Rhodobacteraceae bacterium]|nr:hypothetical protein [Paracoccaceae bacterium]